MRTVPLALPIVMMVLLIEPDFAVMGNKFTQTTLVMSAVCRKKLSNTDLRGEVASIVNGLSFLRFQSFNLKS